ncbi:hypothetical protein TNCV_143921 [Trichonephila clavipes]|nr:hypothetical protein TNCV_143921 [Trichonephila clavipes]
MAKGRLPLAVALSTLQVTERFSSVSPQFRERKPWGWSGACHLTRGLAARRLLKVIPCREVHLQTSMTSPGFEPSPNGTAVSVANHCIGWATVNRVNHIELVDLSNPSFTVLTHS